MATSRAKKPRVGLESGFYFPALSNVIVSFVLADVEITARSLKAEIGAKRWEKDVLGKALEVNGPYFHPFRVKGNPWTNLLDYYSSENLCVSPEMMAKFSRQLKTRALFAMYQDTAGVFFYLLYENGRLIEMLHWGGGSKPTILPDIAKVKISTSVSPPHEFCFASSLRKLKPGELRSDNLEAFFDEFLKSHGIFLVFEGATESKGKVIFKESRLKPEDIERVDFVGLPAQKQSIASQRLKEDRRRVDEIMNASNKAFFMAYRAREEYKYFRSLRPTRTQAVKHEANYKRYLSKVRQVINSAAKPNQEWLYQAALNGNMPVVELLLAKGGYRKDKAALDEAARAARRNNHEDVVQKLIAAGAGPNVRNEIKEVIVELKKKLPPEMARFLDAELK